MSVKNKKMKRWNLAKLLSFGLTCPRKVSCESLETKPPNISLGPLPCLLHGHRLLPTSSIGFFAVLGADLEPCFRNAASSEASRQVESGARSALHLQYAEGDKGSGGLLREKSIWLKRELPTSDFANVCACDDYRLLKIKP